MLANLIVWSAFALVLIGAPLRPWIGVAGYYAFVLAMPKWNWPWAAPMDFPFELYIVLATLLGLLINLNLDAFLHKPTRYAAIALVGFVFFGFLSWQQSIDPLTSAHYFDSMWKICLMAGVSMIVVQTPQQVRCVMWAATISHSYNAYKITMDYFSLGWCRYIQDGWGINTGSNQASIIALAAFTISIGLAVTEKNFVARSLAVLCAVFQSHEIMLLESRGVMIGAVVFLAVVGYVAPKTPKMIGLMTVVVVIGAILAGPPVLKEFSSSFAAGEDLDNSARSRFYTWKAGVNVALDRPMLGSGPAASGLLIAQAYELEWNQERKNAHNQPIEIAADYGLPAALLYYLVVSIAPIQFALRATNDRRTATCLPGYFVAIAGIPGITLATLTSSGLMVEAYYLLLVLGLLTLRQFDTQHSLECELAPSVDMDVA